MKIRVYSDTHLDWYWNYANYATRDFDPEEVDPTDLMWEPPELPDDKDTVLILAGDLWIGKRFIQHTEYSWISKVAQRFKQVLVVLGNHDYWDSISIFDGGKKCNVLLDQMGLYNVKVLDCETFQFEDKVFVGATLWTDMKQRDPLTMMRMPNIMGPDSRINYQFFDNGDRWKFTSEKWVQTHDRHRKFLRDTFKNLSDKELIVITHHMPLPQMGDPAYVGDDTNYYYYSDLSDLIIDNPNVKFWCAGHSHVGNDFMFEQCRMYMNPVGYIGEHREQEGLVKHEVIEV